MGFMRSVHGFSIIHWELLGGNGFGSRLPEIYTSVLPMFE